ncbi:MAG: mismatch-specific DNA-glycosylase [Frankiales bacterium]|nr:mismatch-specific DNA-glycosylase [Frankiales bacterium]
MPGSGPGTSGHTSRVRSRRSKAENEPGHPRPTRADLAAAYGTTIPDLVGPDLRVLLVGINPSLYSGWTGHHFARPGNRLWRTLHEAGFTGRVLHPSETAEIAAAGLGITNLVARATARADELTDDEVRLGVEPLCRLVTRLRRRYGGPAYVAFLGISTYRVAFDRPRAAVGRQPESFEELCGRRPGPTGVWVLPNPSGLNAHYQQPALTAAYADLRAAI